MKCEKCFFCTHIGKGIIDDYPVIYCGYRDEYKLPFVCVHEGETITQRQLDFNKMSDCKIWHEAGCDIHPRTLEKAKRDFIKEIEKMEVKDEEDGKV